jgi:hypothetical protein
MESDGWRDDSDEGPVHDLRVWNEYEIIKSRHNSPIEVRRAGEKIRANFGSIDLAKRWCERDHARRMRERTAKPKSSKRRRKDRFLVGDW